MEHARIILFISAFRPSASAHRLQPSGRRLRNRANWSTKRPAGECPPWPSPTTAICSPPSSFITKPPRGASSRSSAVKFTSREAAGTTAARDAAAAAMPRRTANGASAEPGQRGTNHLVLLCENAEGYQQPRQAGLGRLPRRFLLQAAHRLRPAGKTQPRLDRAFRLPEGRRCRTAAVSGDYDEARNRGLPAAATFSAKAIFSSRCRTRAWKWTSRSIRELVRLSRESGIPLVATNDCHYLTQRRRSRPGSACCASRPARPCRDAHRMSFATDQFYFKTAEEMAQVFARTARGARAHRGHRRALQRCASNRCATPFPEFKVPAGHTLDSYFERWSREGFARARARARRRSPSRDSCGSRWPNTSSGCPTKSR